MKKCFTQKPYFCIFLYVMKENQNIEFKESWRDECLKTLCAFANAVGGTLFIGINDKGEVSGLEEADKMMEDIPNKIRNFLGILVDVNLHTVNGKEYLEIVVESHKNPINYKGQYFYRSGSTKQELKGADLNRFLMQREGKRWDGILVSGVSVTDLKKDSLIRFREKAAKSRRVDEEVLNDSDSILLEDLQLLENGLLKKAALLLFHPQPEKFVQGAYIKIGFFHSDDELAFQDEVHGCIIEQLDKTDELLRTKYTSYAISYSGLSRIETPPFPEKAIREALLNAIAHKDYSDPTPIQISVYFDHIIFWNPGHLPENWTVENLKIKHASKPFNPSIANALFRCGDIEAWGRGTLKMIRESVMHKTLPPDFYSTSTEFSITFYKDAKTSLSQKGVASHLIKIVEYVIENGEIANSDVQKILEVSKRTASRYLSELEKRFLERKGETGKGTLYGIKSLISDSHRGHKGDTNG